MEKGEYTTVATNLHLQLSQVSEQTKTGTPSPGELVTASTDPLSPIHNVQAGASHSLDQSCTFNDENMLLAYVLIKKHITLQNVNLLSVLLHKLPLLQFFSCREECIKLLLWWSAHWVMNRSIVHSWVARSSPNTRSSHDNWIPWRARCGLPLLPTYKNIEGNMNMC